MNTAPLICCSVGIEPKEQIQRQVVLLSNGFFDPLSSVPLWRESTSDHVDSGISALTTHNTGSAIYFLIVRKKAAKFLQDQGYQGGRG
jgi:hypothetical protein